MLLKLRYSVEFTEFGNMLMAYIINLRVSFIHSWRLRYRCKTENVELGIIRINYTFRHKVSK